MSLSLAEQNDLFRRSVAQGLLCTTVPGKFLVTHGVQALPVDDFQAVLGLLAEHSDFPTGDDPYGEHDFGHYTHEGQKFYWKIDYYDVSYEFGSTTPADPTQTRRVLTLMLAEEY